MRQVVWYIWLLLTYITFISAWYLEIWFSHFEDILYALHVEKILYYSYLYQFKEFWASKLWGCRLPVTLCFSLESVCPISIDSLTKKKYRFQWNFVCPLILTNSAYLLDTMKKNRISMKYCKFLYIRFFLITGLGNSVLVLIIIFYLHSIPDTVRYSRGTLKQEISRWN